VTVNAAGTALIDFDPLNAVGGPVGEPGDPSLANYLGPFGVTLSNDSPGTAVVVENQANLAGGGFVLASSQPNVLTQIGSNGPVSFTAGFAQALAQFGFTRPELVAGPLVSHPAWQALAYDALGQVLAETNEEEIASATNVPPQIFILTNPPDGAGIASVQFDSEGTGLTTFNAVVLDDFVLTPGAAGNLPPAVVITSPANDQVFTNTEIALTVETSAGSGTVTNVSYYAGGALAGSVQASPFALTWNAPGNGAYSLTAVAVNNMGLAATSAPVAITVATGFAIASQPQSQTIGVGRTATFDVAATSTNVTYQWQFNGANLAGATQSAYAVSNAPLSAAGSYTVVVTSGDQSLTSAAAVLTVLGPPTLGTPSMVTNDGNIILSLSASDTVPFYYQWQLNGNGIPGAMNTCSAGTTNISFTITNARAFNAGQYQVVVANVVASEESPYFEVPSGLGTPVTTNDNFASSLAIGPLTNGVGVAGINNSASVASADGPALIAGKPAGGFLWYNWTATFSGVISLTTRGSSFDTLLGIYTGSTLESLKSVAEDDDSGGFFTSLVSFNCLLGTNYQMAVAGYQGATGTVVLELSPGPADGFPGPLGGYSVGGQEPVITQQPASQIVNAGDTVTNSVTASGASSYQWYLGGVPVAGGNNNVLIITNFPTSAVGNYYVQASNAAGSLLSTIVAVQIATQNQNGAPTTLLDDKFGDAVDLTGAAAMARQRPRDGGGDTGGFSLSQSFSTAGATKEEGEPNHAGQPGGASYWYSYTATTGGTLDFNTDGSTFPTILAVYIGPGNSFSTLTNVGAAYTTSLDLGQPAVIVSNVAPQTRYFIAIDGYLGASGSAKLNVALVPPPITVNTNVVPVTNSSAGVAITAPANNLLTTKSNLTLQGTVAGSASLPPAAYVQISVNNNPPQHASLAPPHWSAGIDLEPGANLVTAQSITVLGTNMELASLPATHTFFYDVTAPSPHSKAPLTLLISPPGQGKITGQKDQASLELNKVYTVTAAPIGNRVFAGWASGTDSNSLSPLSEGASLGFLMTSNLVLQASFLTNPFTPLAGVYNGLFAPATGVGQQSSGFLTATLPASGHGAYSGKLLLDGGSYPFSGAFDLTGQAEKMVGRTGKPPLLVTLQLNLAAPDNQMAGSVIELADNGWTAPLQAVRATATADYAGHYTLVIPPVNNNTEPGGYGYATLSNNAAGHTAVSGRLADGASFSQSVAIAGDGSIPLYASLYSSKGSLQGWLNLATNPATLSGADLTWIRAEGATLQTNSNLVIVGSAYTPPTGGANALTLSNATLTLSNVTTGATLIYTGVTVTGDKMVYPETGNPPNKLTGLITPGTGVLTVTFRPTGARANVVAKGVVLPDNPDPSAAGAFLDSDQSGLFLIQQ
jgi:hypothetical protein